MKTGRNKKRSVHHPLRTLRAGSRVRLFPSPRLAFGSVNPAGPGLLQALARAHGIQLSYQEMSGRLKVASPECLKGLLQASGVAAGTRRECFNSLRELELWNWRQALPLVCVAWDNKPAHLKVHFPSSLSQQRVPLVLHLEDGTRKTVACTPANSRLRGAARIDGQQFFAYEVTLPPLPFGYHRLALEIRGRAHSSLLISSPSHAYHSTNEADRWGLFLPLYALHSQRSWGAGNLTDYEGFIDWVDSLGGRVVAALPLLAGFSEASMCEPSPYSPVSRLFWNEFYIDIVRVPDFATCRAAQKLLSSGHCQRLLDTFRKARYVDYPAEAALRRSVLELLARSFFRSSSSRLERFEQFLRSSPQLNDYAEFRATCDQRQSPWPGWEERMRQGKLQPGDFSEAGKKYHLYCQWIVEEQLTEMFAKCRRRSIRFHLDLPLGVHPNGYDTWRRQELFASSARVGAPPDMFFTQGQNWGFPPLNPKRLRERGYSYVLDFLRFQMRHATLLRIDHVMGLHRLYWIPSGLPADEGSYVSYPAEEIYAILCLESQRHKTVLVGENLGTVPPEVTRAMDKHRLRQIYVAQYSHLPSAARPLRLPPRRCVAALNTHDMPTFASHWRGIDLRHRSKLGLLTKAGALRANEERQKNLAGLEKFLRRHHWLKPEQVNSASVARATLAWLATTRAETVLINLEDLWGETRPQNVPGLVLRKNWARKTRLSLEQIQASKDIATFLREVSRLRKLMSRRRTTV